MKISNKSSTNSVASIIISTFAMVAGISTVSTARAGDDEPRKTMIVSYADLNVDTEQGAKVLYARIRQAAQDVCATLESRELLVRAKWLRCFDSAMLRRRRPSQQDCRYQAISSLGGAQSQELRGSSWPNERNSCLGSGGAYDLAGRGRLSFYRRSTNNRLSEGAEFSVLGRRCRRFESCHPDHFTFA